MELLWQEWRLPMHTAETFAGRKADSLPAAGIVCEIACQLRERNALRLRKILRTTERTPPWRRRCSAQRTLVPLLILTLSSLQLTSLLLDQLLQLIESLRIMFADCLYKA